MNLIKLEDSKNAMTGASPAWIAMLLGAAVACSGSGASIPGGGAQSATIGSQGGEIVGAKDSALEGVKLTIPAGALARDTRIEIGPSAEETSLPGSVVRSGPQFAIGPAGTQLAVPARVTLPFDEEVVTTNSRFDDEVGVWVRKGDHFGQREQVDSEPGSVTAAEGNRPPGDVVRFELHPNPQFLRCLAQFPGDAQRAPSVEVTVLRGSQNDSLSLRGRNIKPGLKFDLFTVEHTSLAADATVDPAFRGNFGLATYQSDLEASEEGRVRAAIRTILLDENFSFDPTVTLAPTGTFNVGFWFDDPSAAVDCGFNPLNPTPFNGEHKAGPLAMISTPDASTGLGPLSTHPDTSTTSRDHFGQQQKVESAPGSVTVDISSLDIVAAGVDPAATGNVARFDLHPNPQFQRCLAQFPGDAARAPSVEVTVVRGSQNDGLFLRGRNIKPGLAFDLFTVEHTNLAADATVDPAFRGNFGLATYQSDLDASDEGQVRAAIRTILLEENFSFDPGAGLAPTSTFNVGFWFDDPNAAVDCGFNPLNPTPFNGDHKAGPLAMISTPDASTGLGPLCTHPDTSTTPARCSP